LTVPCRRRIGGPGMDTAVRMRETEPMPEPGGLRQRLASRLGSAFAEGLLSEQTLNYRLGLLFGPRLIEPRSVVGDLALRFHRRRPFATRAALAFASVGRSLRGLFRGEEAEPVLPVLALDWSGARHELLIGRGPACDIPLSNRTVSRQH